MKVFRMALIIAAILACFIPCEAQTFAEWFKQNATQKKYLIQQILKLQMYLTFTKKGYNIVNKGLGTIGDFKNEDLLLHGLFFNDLNRVKPVISNHSNVKEIENTLSIIMNNVQKIKDLLSNSGMFLQDDMKYIKKQIDNMLKVLQDDIKSLNDVISDLSLQMSDNERVERINKICRSVMEKKRWVIQVSEDCTLLTLQRHKGLEDLRKLKQIYPPILK